MSEHRVTCAINYSARSYASAEYWIHCFGGVHAFGYRYNTAESEPIWMKSGAF